MTSGESIARNSKGPPLGGANLECLLTCEGLAPTKLPALIGICHRHGFKLIDHESLLAYGDDLVDPQIVDHAKSLAAFVETMEHQESRRCIANLDGTLLDTQTSLSVLLDLEKQVVVVSVPEDVLWRFEVNAENADIKRLVAFSDLCREVASEIDASLGYLGTEELHPEDMVTSRTEAHGATRVDDHFFSDTRLKELFDWYTGFYATRWKE